MDVWWCYVSTKSSHAALKRALRPLPHLLRFRRSRPLQSVSNPLHYRDNLHVARKITHKAREPNPEDALDLPAAFLHRKARFNGNLAYLVAQPKLFYRLMNCL
ncbi:hypothetical protein MTP99_016728 [Tenebrio molitor]|nr:hypothetical protein MTP99_016728 [Tenebrio molitor]